MGKNWDKQGNYQKYNSDGSTPVAVVGSLAIVFGDPFPVGEEGQQLEVFHPIKEDNQFFRFVQGQWREY